MQVTILIFDREHAPSIIFMDEIDSIGSARMESGTGNGDSEVQRTMLELLNQLDGFEASNKIKVLFKFLLLLSMLSVFSFQYLHLTPSIFAAQSCLDLIVMISEGFDGN